MRIYRVVLVAFLLSSAVAFGLRVSPVAALINISGSWNVTMSHPDLSQPDACTATVTQVGSSVALSMNCTQLGAINASGSINTTTGSFTLSGTLGPFSFVMTGTASGDGNSMSGTWQSGLVGGTGTFTGSRKSVPLGGIAEVPEVAGSPVRARDDSRASDTGLVTLLAGGVAAAGMLGGLAWYARRRRL